MPGGGIIPARSFRVILSAVSACSAAFSTEKAWSDTFPVIKASLWQTTQYCWTTSVRVAGATAGEPVGSAGVAGATETMWAASASWPYGDPRVTPESLLVTNHIPANTAPRAMVFMLYPRESRCS